MRSGVVLIISVLLSAPILGQVKQLSFAEAIAIGLNENFVMKNTRNDLKTFKSNKALQISSFTPNLGMQAGISQTTGPQLDAELGAITATSESFNTGIGSSLVIFSGNSRIHDLKASSYRLEGQELLIKRTEQDIMNQVAVQFLQVLLDQELLRIAEENLVSQQETLEQITGFVEAGNRAEVDKYRQEADVKSFELLVIQAQNTLTRDKSTLAQTLQLDPTQEFVVVRPNWNVDQIRAMTPNLDELYATALASRADFQRFETIENSAQQDYKSALNGYMPFLSGFINFGSSYFNPNIPSQPADPFVDQLKNRRSTSYGINLTIPIWDRLLTRNTRVGTRVAYENAQNQLENAEKVVKIDVLNAYNNFSDVKSGYEVSLAQFEAAKLAYDTQKESYEVGLATQVELAVANAQYVSAQSNLAQTGYRLLFQKILLDYAVGTLSLDSIKN